MLGLYPPSAFDAYKKEKTRFPTSVDAVVEKIHEACAGVGTDDKTLVKLIGPLTPNDRGLVSLRYKELHGQSLRELVKSETSGDFGYLLQLICFSLPEAEAYILFHAMKGAGTSDHLIYSILMGRTNEEISVLKKAFFEMYDTDLSVAISDEVSGDFLAVLMKALQEPMVEYKASFHTKEKAAEDAELIYKAGEGKWGTDENGFIKLLLSSPPEHLRNIDAAYQAKYQHDLVYAIENEFSGSDSAALTYFVRLNLNAWPFLAEHIEGAMAGIGTDESALSAAIVRYHPYLGNIMPAYERKYKMSLHDRIEGEVGGEYQELLLQLLQTPRSVGSVAKTQVANHAHDVFRGVPLVYPHEIDDVCERIRDATDGLGVDEKVLVDALSALSASDRSLLIYRYKDLYREELKDTLSRET
uniref:Annexin n=2 Tax=Phytophthora ramorum TaxID=164328 RepID=H3HB96_PHYRM